MVRRQLNFVFVALLITLTQASDPRSRTVEIPDDISSNTIDDDANPFAEAASALFSGKDGKGADLGGMMNSFMQSDGGKNLGEMLMGAVGNNPGGAAQILSGIGSMLNNKNAGAALDPSILGNVIGMLAENQGGKKDDSNGVDIAGLMNMAGDFLGNSGLNVEDSIGLLPTMVSTLNAFLGPEAQEREAGHAGHAWLLPPVVEKLHVMFDHFAHSELGRSLWRTLGAEKLFIMLSKDGNFDFKKFLELLENHSFRRHWIHLVVEKITNIVATISDPRTHKKYITTGLSIVNGFLKSHSFPKSTYIDLQKPAETITGAVNYFFKRFLNMPVSSKPYVVPAVKYVQEVIALAQNKGILLKEGLDSRALSNKLTDTLNLEIIEPIARVYRAYRFAKKVPECDKYVMCVVNQQDQNEVLSLPGLKPSLSRAASFASSWFLSSHTGTSFWTLYSVIFDEDDCSVRFREKCNDFHIEEIKVTTEYVHNEL